jgi:hypothetical protein
VPKIFGVARPYATWGVEWTGDNIDEVKAAFEWFPSSLFFVNEENNNLCFGANIDEANQFPLGTIMVMLGGVSGITRENWESQYSTVDSDGRLKYNVLQDQES